MKSVPLGPWLPDQSKVSSVLSMARNCLPTLDGYRPLASPVPFGTALPASFAGGESFTGADGTSALLAGTSTGLFQYAGGNWTSLVSGIAAVRWRFTQFGDYVIAVNGTQTQVVHLNSGATASALAGAPAGIAVTTVGDYVVIGQALNDRIGIYTSAFNDHTDWNPAGSGGATIQPMLTGGEVMGLAGGEYGVILQRQRLVRMSRTGDDTAPFQYDEITPNIGCASKASVVQKGRSVYFLSDSGFMALNDGQALTPIGSEKVDREFQKALDRNSYEQIFSALDPVNKLVMWAIPGTPGRIFIYHYELDRWTDAELPLEGIFSGTTPSTTMEEVALLYTSIDAVPGSLDDAMFLGNAPKVYLVQARTLAKMTGPNLRADWRLPFISFSGDRIARFRTLRPVTDAIAGNAVALDVRNRLGDAARVVSCAPMRASGVMPVRCSGRYAQIAWSITAGESWSFANAIGVEYEAGSGR